MIVVADSGSTKTDWRLVISENNIEQFQSIGLNPNFHNETSVLEAIEQTFVNEEQNEKVKAVFFYGAGCSTENAQNLIQEQLQKVFVHAKVNVAHDLLAAARASCGHQAGLAAILGTGSNCCVFDGSEVVSSFPSGGYSIGDEGGGVHIGKRILKAYFEDYMPKDLRERFDFRYQLSLDEILENLYKKPNPNRFMASFSQFAFQHKEDAFVTKELLQVFDDFFENKVLRFHQARELPLNLVGSIAFYYNEYIRTVAESKGISIGTILEKPIAGLSLYHIYSGEQ
jgi:N-acetylglucosamine kinase-like BadF-type ATPase